MMTDKLFVTALGISEPWHVSAVDVDAAARTLAIRADFAPCSQFCVEGQGRTQWGK